MREVDTIVEVTLLVLVNHVNDPLLAVRCTLPLLANCSYKYFLCYLCFSLEINSLHLHAHLLLTLQLDVHARVLSGNVHLQPFPFLLLQPHPNLTLVIIDRKDAQLAGTRPQPRDLLAVSLRAERNDKAITHDHQKQEQQ